MATVTLELGGTKNIAGKGFQIGGYSNVWGTSTLNEAAASKSGYKDSRVTRITLVFYCDISYREWNYGWNIDIASNLPEVPCTYSISRSILEVIEPDDGDDTNNHGISFYDNSTHTFTLPISYSPDYEGQYVMNSNTIIISFIPDEGYGEFPDGFGGHALYIKEVTMDIVAAKKWILDANGDKIYVAHTNNNGELLVSRTDDYALYQP